MGGEEGVEIYIDDLLIGVKDKIEHDMRLKNVLEKARERNIKFNLSKHKIGVPEVKYGAHKFSKDGLKPDEGKIKAIIAMKPPNNSKELETFLGMITCLKIHSEYFTSYERQPSYRILKEDGQALERNRRHVHKSPHNINFEIKNESNFLMSETCNGLQPSGKRTKIYTIFEHYLPQ